MILTDYLTKGLNLSNAQVEAITKLAEACGMVDLFEGASPFGNLFSKVDAFNKAQEKKDEERSKKASQINVTRPVVGDESLFDTGEDADLDELITPEGNAIGMANAGFAYGEEADSESDSTLSNFGKSDVNSFRKTVNSEDLDVTVDDDDDIDVGSVSNLMAVVKRMAEYTKFGTEQQIKHLMTDAASADQSVSTDATTADALSIDSTDDYGRSNHTKDSNTIQRVANMVKEIAPTCNAFASDDPEPLRELRKMVTELVKTHNTPFVKLTGLDQLVIDPSSERKENDDQLTSVLSQATGIDPNSNVGSSKDYLKQKVKRKLTGTIRK